MNKQKLIMLTLVATLSGAGDLFSKEPMSFDQADANKDGKLSPSEFSAADQGRKGSESTSEMFKKTDTDGDKWISPTEFAPYRIRRDMAKKPKKKKDD